ncbi:MAG: response regulator [Sandaracinaceae bacterium]|nr:response regulator [Sandaracinaceae bacterium]
MGEGDEDGRARLERENARLRRRVAELERKVNRVEDASAELGAPFAERIALWQEAERIAHVGTWLWNLQTDEVRWSEELFHILGYDPARDAASTEAFFARVHPDDRARVSSASERALGASVAEQVDYRVLWPDGTVRHVSMDAAMIYDEAGALARVVGTIHDLTDQHDTLAALRAGEQMLDEVARAVGVGWFRYDVASQELSGSLEQVLGISHGGAIDLAEVAGRLLPADRMRALVKWQQLRAGQPSSPLQVSVAGTGGRMRHLEVVPQVEADASGPVRVRGVVIDVTERVELERRLRQTEKMEVLGQVTAGVAHDFNNLLTIILCNVERLPRQGREEAVDYIVGAAQSAAQLTRRLLAFGRQAVVEPVDVDVVGATEECLAIVGRAFEDHIVIEHQPSDVAAIVRADPGQLQQILLNLVLNARDAMRARGGTLTIRSSRSEVGPERAAALEVTPGSFVELTVADTGVGMEPAVLERIFEPFFTTKEPGKGTGLGLATVFGAVRQSGGGIEVSSEPGVGTTFRVLLPVGPGVPAVSPAPSVAAIAPRRILLVEDEPDVATSLARMLRGHGHDVTACTTPSSGIAAWRRSGGFELLITDYLMPEMTGLELTERLRTDAPSLPVLVLSGWGYQAGAVTSVENAFALSKPFSGDELLRAIGRATGASTPAVRT